ITRTVPDPIPDTTPPVISGIAPAGGSSTANGSVVLTYAASDNSGIAPVCTPASGATHALVVGSNSILITCTDASNNQATATVVITRTAIVITTPPPEPTPDTTAPIVATKTLISGKPKFATNRRSASTTYVCAKATCVVTLKITIAKKRYSVKSKPLPISSSDTPVKAMIKMPSTLAKKLVAAKKKRQKVTLKAVIA
ncbi:MAG: hypothetical protein ACRDKE_05535, partial [Solirubrobacterales bacterium]